MTEKDFEELSNALANIICEYKKALDDEGVKKPICYALHKTCKKYDKIGRRRSE